MGGRRRVSEIKTLTSVLDTRSVLAFQVFTLIWDQRCIPKKVGHSVAADRFRRGFKRYEHQVQSLIRGLGKAIS